MELTKVKRRELKRGDMFCAEYKKAVSEVYMVTADGDDVIDLISNMEVYRIDVPDVERLRCENEKLAVDSVALDEIISVVYGWNRDARGYPDIAMKKIAKIIDERGD